VAIELTISYVSTEAALDIAAAANTTFIAVDLAALGRELANAEAMLAVALNQTLAMVHHMNTFQTNVI
jgi:hypothetical protein